MCNLDIRSLDPLCILVLSSSSAAFPPRQRAVLVEVNLHSPSLQGNWAGAGIVLILTVNDCLLHRATWCQLAKLTEFENSPNLLEMGPPKIMLFKKTIPVNCIKFL